MTAADIEAVFAVLRAAYPWQRVEPGAQKVWRAALGDLLVADIQAAVAEWVQQSERWPSIAAVREAAKERRRVRQAVEDASQALRFPVLPTRATDTPGERSKGQAQVRNLMAWCRGEVDTATMVERCAEIYVSQAPFPPDSAAGGVIAAHLDLAGRLRTRGDGPLVRHMRRVWRDGHRTWVDDPAAPTAV